jgi:hypothetical protein
MATLDPAYLFSTDCVFPADSTMLISCDEPCDDTPSAATDPGVAALLESSELVGAGDSADSEE